MSDQVDFSVVGFETYQDYLLSFANTDDKRFLNNPNVTAVLVQLGYRTTQVPYEREEFTRRVDIAMEALRPKILGIQPYSRFMAPENKDPVLLEFKRREMPNFLKRIATVVFTSYIHQSGSDISGYLDLSMSWRTAMFTKKGTDWTGIYEGTARLLPMPYDLSYSDPKHNIVTYNNSDNFTVLNDSRYGIVFMHKGDRNLILLGGNTTKAGKSTTRSMVSSPKFGTMIFYDHIVRKMN